MNRYKITSPKAQCDMVIDPDDNGEWVRFDDVDALIRISANIADRHDAYRSALKGIAKMPISFPSIVGAIALAKKTLEEDHSLC